jgi:hypothetical protein
MSDVFHLGPEASGVMKYRGTVRDSQRRRFVPMLLMHDYPWICNPLPQAVFLLPDFLKPRCSLSQAAAASLLP